METMSLRSWEILYDIFFVLTMVQGGLAVVLIYRLLTHGRVS